ncbi:MAG: DUF2147 domain-containing protein [Hyphomicrobium sp.]|uniref:DUF2147 domain-containing protein n=1 Tax=Hyphomicrobium sp. TaxID=82 RepID=UPI003D09F1EC
MLPSIRTLTLAAAGAVIATGSANAASDATGIWFDHNGRGAVEIAPCASGNGLCGYVVHIKEAKNSKRCGMQILGNVTSDGGGWIYSPDRGKKYSVELTRLSDDKLRVVGNAGSFFSKTYTWNRAPDDVARCGEQQAAAPAKPVEKKKEIATESAPAPAETTTAETEAYPTGAPSASMALMGVPKKKKKRVAEATPVATGTETATDASPAPAVTEEKAPAKEEVAAGEAEAAPAEETFEPERKCKYKIPYVGRVISVPCRD